MTELKIYADFGPQVMDAGVLVELFTPYSDFF